MNYSITPIQDVDRYVLSEFLDIKDTNKCLHLNKYYKELYKERFTWLKYNTFVPISILDVSNQDKIKRIYRNNTRIDIDYIIIRYGVVFQWYLLWKLKDKITRHTVYDDGKKYMIRKDHDDILSIYIYER